MQFNARPINNLYDINEQVCLLFTNGFNDDTFKQVTVNISDDIYMNKIMNVNVQCTISITYISSSSSLTLSCNRRNLLSVFSAFWKT